MIHLKEPFSSFFSPRGIAWEGQFKAHFLQGGCSLAFPYSFFYWKCQPLFGSADIPENQTQNQPKKNLFYLWPYDKRWVYPDYFWSDRLYFYILFFFCNTHDKDEIPVISMLLFGLGEKRININTRINNRKKAPRMIFLIMEGSRNIKALRNNTPKIT